MEYAAKHEGYTLKRNINRDKKEFRVYGIKLYVLSSFVENTDQTPRINSTTIIFDTLIK